MSTPALNEVDAARLRAFRRMRWAATGLLLLAAACYVVTLRDTRQGWLGYANAAAEAGMVGGLADWFAVTALFKRPLGLPIPHTALIQRRKDDLGRSLQHFVTANFLTEEIIRERVAAAHIGERLAEWLSTPDHRRRAITQIVKGGRVLLLRVKDDDVRALVEENVLPRIEREDLSPIVGALLEGVVADGAHQSLVDLVFAELHDWLVRHPEDFRSVVVERVPGWAPDWVDRRVEDWAHKQALRWTAAVRDERHHRARIALDGLLAKLARDMQHDERIRARAESLKLRLIGSRGVAPALVSLWTSLRASLVDAIDDRESSLWRRGDGWLQEIGTAVADSAEVRARIDASAQDIAAFIVATYGAELTTVISATVERWDAREAADRIELFVGRDLQFIRINGTVVGALAGLAIHGFSEVIR